MTASPRPSGPGSTSSAGALPCSQPRPGPRTPLCRLLLPPWRVRGPPSDPTLCLCPWAPEVTPPAPRLSASAARRLVGSSAVSATRKHRQPGHRHHRERRRPVLSWVCRARSGDPAERRSLRAQGRVLSWPGSRAQRAGACGHVAPSSGPGPPPTGAREGTQCPPGSSRTTPPARAAHRHHSPFPQTAQRPPRPKAGPRPERSGSPSVRGAHTGPRRREGSARAWPSSRTWVPRLGSARPPARRAQTRGLGLRALRASSSRGRLVRRGRGHHWLGPQQSRSRLAGPPARASPEQTAAWRPQARGGARAPQLAWPAAPGCATPGSLPPSPRCPLTRTRGRGKPRPVCPEWAAWAPG